MKKIKPFALNFFTNHALASFCAEVESHICTDLPPEEKMLGENFSSHLKTFKELLAASQETFNDAILTADRETDAAWSAIDTLLRLNIRHFDCGIREAAQKVINIFETTDNPTRLPYAEEYARLESLLAKLSEIPEDTLKRAMVSDWIDELRRRVNAFHALRKAKTQARSEIETGATKTARNNLILVYRNLVDTINARIIIDSPVPFKTLAQHINTLIDTNRTALKMRKSAKTDKNTASGADE